MLNALKRSLAALGLAGLPLVAGAQEKKNDPSPLWVETRFHRVHLKNGNFIDGSLVSKDRRLVVLKMNPGNFSIRTDMVERVEFVKVRSLHETPKLEDIPKEALPEGPPAVAEAKRPEGPPAPAVVPLDAPASLAEKLSKESPERRRTSLRELMAAKGAEGPEFIAALLERVSGDARPDVVALLLEREAVSALPVLLKLLKNADPAVRESALKAIYGLGSDSSVSQVRFCLSDPDPLVRAAAIMVYQRFGSPDDFQTVAAKLKDADPSVRGTALASLQSLASRLELKEQLAETLRVEVEEASSPDTAAAIVAAIGKIGDKSLAPELVKFSESELPKVRAEALLGLVTTDREAAGKVILARLEVETEYEPRIQLAEGARKLRLREAIAPLIDWLQMEDVNLRSTASSALRAITGQNFGADHERWSAWWENAKPK